MSDGSFTHSRPTPALRRPHDLRIATVRRAVDVLIGALLVAIVAPVCLLIAAAILVEDGGAVIFTQTRVGRGGRPFRILKFRTMAPDTVRKAASGSPLRQRGDDPRCTRVGRCLRRSHLDELPQLVNVILGDMTLVGPRPLVPEEDEIVEPRLGAAAQRTSGAHRGVAGAALTGEDRGGADLPRPALPRKTVTVA